jgi:hypothetical protein
MPSLLVSDTSVLIDLDRGGLLETLFQLAFGIAVPDVLYASELESWRGRELVELGLQVLELDENGVSLAQAYTTADRRISLPDGFALALARIGGHVLLTGDQHLRALAGREGVGCHGLLWVLDEFESSGLVSSGDLLAGLALISSHRRSRLPVEEVRERENRYRRRMQAERRR